MRGAQRTGEAERSLTSQSTSRSPVWPLSWNNGRAHSGFDGEHFRERWWLRIRTYCRADYEPCRRGRGRRRFPELGLRVCDVQWRVAELHYPWKTSSACDCVAVPALVGGGRDRGSEDLGSSAVALFSRQRCVPGKKPAARRLDTPSTYSGRTMCRWICIEGGRVDFELGGGMRE